MKIYKVTYLSFDPDFDITEYYISKHKAESQSATKYDDAIDQYVKSTKEIETLD